MVEMVTGKFVNTQELKSYVSKDMSFIFDKKTGYTTIIGPLDENGKEIHDAEWCPAGPIIADIEISTICKGIAGRICPHCYKTNSPVGTNMSLETFKVVFDKLPKIVTQIAFGIGDLDSNGDMFDIFHHTRNGGVIPNVTTNGYGLTPDLAQKLVDVCGAVAVSRYSPKDVCYDAVKLLTDTGLKQCNIHQLVSKETLANCYETIKDIKEDQRLEKLNAIVFLSLKKKGDRNNFTPVSQEEFQELVLTCLKAGVSFGFDSCSANKFLKSVEHLPEYETYKTFSEPCESTLFSSYINVDGDFYPCSFCEGEGEWKEGISVLEGDFLKDVWLNQRTFEFRDKLKASCRSCPVFEV